GNRLHRRRIQRQDHHLDAMAVHLGEPPFLDVEQPGLQFRPVAVRYEAGRIHQRVGDGEMLFERDFSLHAFLPLLSQYWPCGVSPSTICPYMVPTASQFMLMCRPTALASRQARCTGLARSRPNPPVDALSASTARMARPTENAWPRRLMMRSSIETSLPARTVRARSQRSRSKVWRAASTDAAASATRN